MTTPMNVPTEDLVRLAELVSGRRILSQGAVVPLTTSEWLDRWQDLPQ